MELSYFDTYTQIYIYAYTIVIGLCMGSFLNCCAYRACHNLSILKGRSKCDHCDHQLGFIDLIPVVSYLLSKGKCRYCGEKLSIRYVISEIVTALTYVIIVRYYGISLETLEYLILASILLCASFADLEDFLIPDICIVLGLVNRLVFVLLSNDVLSELLSSIFGALVISVPLYILVIVMEKVLKRDAMGGGDIKLVLMIGSYLSFAQSLLGLLVASIIGIVFAFVTKKRDQLFPFGPSLCLGYFISLLYGTSIISWYLSLF